MIKRDLIYILLFFTVVHVTGQSNPYGKPIVVNYPPQVTKGSEQNWAIAQDKRGVMYFGNNDNGVLEYDGSEWRSIPVANNSIVRSLDCADDGTIYVGAVAEVGYLAPNAAGDMQYNSLIYLLDSADRRFYDVWKTYCRDDKVYFHSQKTILIYYPKEKRFETYIIGRHALFGFHEKGNYYVGYFPLGLMVFEQDTLVLAKGGDYYKEKDIFGLASYDDKHLLIGATGFGISLYNIETGEVNDDFASAKTNDYLNNNYLTQLISLKNGNFLASTGGGGVVVISREGEILEVVSKDEGLQEQVVYSSYESMIDYPYPTIWSALDIGISKIEINSPLRVFNEEYGYEGLIHTIGSIGDRLYIGTATGIYELNLSDSKATFKNLGEFSQRIWDIKKIYLPSGKEKLLAIGRDGLIEINPGEKAVKLNEKIKGKLDVEDRIFWGFSILQDIYDQRRVYLGRKSSLTSLIYKNGSWYQEYAIDSLGDEIHFMARMNDKLWFGSKLMGLGCIHPLTENGKDYYYDERNGLPDKGSNSVFQLGEKVVIGTSNGIFRIIDNPDTLYFEKDSILNKYLQPGTNKIREIYEDPDGAIWISYENDKLGNTISMLLPTSTNKYNAVTKPFLNLENFSTDAFYSIDGKGVYFSKVNKLFHFDKSIPFKEGQYKALIRKVTVNTVKFDTVIYNGAYPIPGSYGSYMLGESQANTPVPAIKYINNNVEFRWSAPYFEQEEKIEYSYYLQGFSSNWSNWESVLYQDFTNLPNGTYTFMIKARNIYLDESEIDSFSFIILRPWYKTFWAFMIYFILAVVIVFVIIKVYTQRLKNENIRLEGIILDRTAEIRKQKEELTDSIEYASRIQRALLPPEDMLSEHQVEHFILFRPRDIVSGDFYWFGKANDRIFIVAADCTGHGVPGAFMSMLGISFLDEIIIKSKTQNTDQILNKLRDHVITSLRQSGKGIAESTKDGMDLAMIAIDQSANKVQFSGAYNPLYVVRELNTREMEQLESGNELELERGSIHNDSHLLYQVKGDAMPIGISEKKLDFTATDIKLTGQDTLYLFSDGFVDQFGGPSGKKFMSKNFKKLLLDIQNLSMEEQQKKLNSTLLNWMGDISQIDDILVIGVKFS